MFQVFPVCYIPRSCCLVMASNNRDCLHNIYMHDDSGFSQSVGEIVTADHHQHSHSLFWVTLGPMTKYLFILRHLYVLKCDLLLDERRSPTATVDYLRTLPGFGMGDLLLALASRVVVGSESCGTHDHILLSPNSGSHWLAVGLA
jgi:hypothetical protein